MLTDTNRWNQQNSECKIFNRKKNPCFLQPTATTNYKEQKREGKLIDLKRKTHGTYYEMQCVDLNRILIQAKHK